MNYKFKNQTLSSISKCDKVKILFFFIPLRYIEEREKQWSPEQIKGYCDVNKIEMVSHERIYQYIRKDEAKGGNLYKNLRHKLKEGKLAQCLAKTVVNRLLPYKNFVKSITSDNGSEFAQHQDIAQKLQTDF